jgi:hypothetical protein
MLLWCDGFDHYGSDETNMLDGVYAAVGGMALDSSVKNTGTHSIYVSGNDSTSANTGLRKVLPSSVDKIGAAGRFYFPNLPNANPGPYIFDFLSSNPNRSQIAVTVDANGAVRFYRGSNHALSGDIGTLIAQSDPIVVASAWNHIEVQIYIHDTLGWVRVAVNGVHRYEATGLDTKYDTTEIVSVGNHSGYYATNGGTYSFDFYMDDYMIYDFDGDSAVDTDFCPEVDGSGLSLGYIGELQVMLLKPNGDTSEDDWVPSTGSDAYAMVDEATPDDADYIYSTAAGDLTELSFEDLPEDITYVRGVQFLGRMSKSDSGAAMVKFGMKSFSSYIDEAERPITTEPTYWWDFLNIDPNTGAATGTLTFTGQPADGDTVTIGAKVYTFQAVLTNVDGNVFIGANLAATIANLADAINLGAGAGVDYAAATTLHTQVAGTAGATTLIATAKEAGTGGNAIATTETSANASWGGATLSGGDAGARWTRATLNAAWMRLTRSV